MYITLEEDKPMDKEEVKPTGGGAKLSGGDLDEIEARFAHNPPLREYLAVFGIDIAALLEALRNARATNEVLHGSLREFCAANGSAVDRVRVLTGALRRMLDCFAPFSSADTEAYREECEAYEQARAALALVDGPLNQETK